MVEDHFIRHPHVYEQRHDFLSIATTFTTMDLQFRNTRAVYHLYFTVSGPGQSRQVNAG